MFLKVLIFVTGFGGLSSIAAGVTDSEFENLKKIVAVQQAKIASLEAQNRDYFKSMPVVYFAGTKCPTGWTEKADMRGRYVVAAQSSASLGRLVGSALSDQENRATGLHNHIVDDPGHRHPVYIAQSRTGADSGVIGDMPTANNLSGATRPIIDAWNHKVSTDIQLRAAGSVEGTNAPYIQLLACVRSALSSSSASQN